MSSNIRVVKVCEYCKIEFVARKTTFKTCSDNCAKRMYKLNQRNNKINQTTITDELKRKPEAFMTEEKIKFIQCKENLTLKEAAILLNISPLTLKRWIFNKKVVSAKIGRKHIIKQ